MSPFQGIEEENDSAVYHEPLVEGQLVEIFRNETVFGHAQRWQHRLLPKTTAAFNGCEGKDDAKSQYAFDWARHQSQGECLSVVLVPGLYIKRKCGYPFAISNRF